MRREYPKKNNIPSGSVNSGASQGVPESEKLENVRKSHVKAKRKNTALSLLVLCIIIAVGGYLCYAKLFKIQKLTIKGDCPYTEQEMMEGMGLAFGDTLYGKSNEEILQDVKYNLAYIDNLKISRIWPSTLKVTVEKANPTFYVSLNDSMYVLSQSLRVLSRTENIEDVELRKLVSVEITGIESCVEGEFLETDNGADEILKELYSLLEKYEVFAEITNIDMTDRFDIRLSYGTKYLVKLGDKVNLDSKIQFMLTIIDEKSNDGTSGIIDVSDDEVKEGTFENFT